MDKIRNKIGLNYEKLFNNLRFKKVLVKWEVKKILNNRTKAAMILSVALIAGLAGSVIALQSTVKADNNTIVAADMEPTPSAITNDDNAVNTQTQFIMEPRFERGLRGGIARCGGFGAGAIQVSEEYTTSITNIAENDSDVAALISQDYNITAIHPVFSSVVDGNGNVVTKASTANLILQGTTGRALVVVDIDQAKVTKIVTFTVTEVDK